MTTTTLETGRVSRAELELALRAVVLQGRAAEHGRERARRVTGLLTTVLATTAGAVALLDVLLLAAA